MKKVLFFLIISSSSCFKKSNYQIQVFNNSNYTFQELIVSTWNNKSLKSLPPFQMSEVYVNSTQVLLEVGETQELIVIKQAIAPNGDTINSDEGIVLGHSKFSECRINTIMISWDSANSTSDKLKWSYKVIN